MTAWAGRVVAGRQQLAQVGRGEVGRGPLGHRQDRIALIDRLPGQQLVALVEDLVEVLEDRRVLVLERVGVLVREVEAFGRAGLPATLRDDVELALVTAVEGRDAAAQQVEAQGPQARIGRDQTERLVEPLGPGQVGRRRVLIELGREQRPQLRRVDELAGDRLASAGDRGWRRPVARPRRRSRRPRRHRWPTANADGPAVVDGAADGASARGRRAGGATGWRDGAVAPHAALTSATSERQGGDGRQASTAGRIRVGHGRDCRTGAEKPCFGSLRYRFLNRLRPRP